MEIVRIEDIEKSIKNLGLQSRAICIHSSLKSFGFVEGGTKAIIQAFLELDCTILVPTFTDCFEVFPPENMRPTRNGAGDYSYFENKSYDNSKIFTTDIDEIRIEEMGMISAQVLKMSERKRGYHPLNSFSAVGKLAEVFVKNQSPENVYAPLQELCNRDGVVLFMGVNLDSGTIVHYAEQIAGRKAFVRWANDLQGNPMCVFAGGCSDGFNKFSDYLKPIEKSLCVGKSLWRSFSARSMVDICSKLICEKPEITKCEATDCVRCLDAISGGPLWRNV